MCRMGRVFDLQTRNNGVDKVRAMRRKRLGGYMCRAGRVFEVQTRSNGAEKVKVLLRKGCDGTIVPIKKLDVF